MLIVEPLALAWVNPSHTWKYDVKKLRRKNKKEEKDKVQIRDLIHLPNQVLNIWSADSKNDEEYRILIT